MVLAAGVCLSTSGLILRDIHAASGWQILFWRNVGSLAALGVFVALRYRARALRAVLDTGAAGVVVALSLAAGAACYVMALLLTTVANVVFIVAASPFVTSVLAWLVLGERVGRRALAAMLAALAGISLMFADGLVAGGLTGDVVALGVVASYAVMLVAIRRAGNVDMVPAVWLASLFGALAAAPLAGSLALERHDLLLALLMGSTQFGVGFILITLGARHVPAAEVALLSLTETVLAPMWVWLAFGERPHMLDLTGGVVVLVAVVGHAVGAMRDARAPC